MRRRHRFGLKAILLSTCLLAPTLAFAQDGQSNEATDLEEVVITGQIQYRNRTDTVAPELVYDQEFFAQFEPTSVGDQLKRVPGVAFTSDIGEYDAPQLRGLGQGFTQVLINGRPIPGAGNDRTVFVDRIPAEIIDRIEIVRSPSADIDSQGIGGTINIILKDGESLPPGVIARAGATYDADNEELRPSASLSVSGRNDSGTVLYSVTLDAQQRFNQKHVVEEVFEDDSVGFDDVVARRGMGRGLARFNNRSQSVAVERVEEEDWRDSTDLSFNGDLTFRLRDDTSLRFDAFVLSTEREEGQDTTIFEGDGTVGGLDIGGAEFEAQEADFRQTSWGISALFETDFSENVSFNSQVRFNNFVDDSVEESFEDGGATLVERESIDADDSEWTADAAFTIQMPSIAESFGIEGVEVKVGAAAKVKEREYRLTTDDGLDDPDYETIDGRFSYEERRIDVFARAEFKISPELTFQVGARAESTRTEQAYTTDFLEGGILDDTVSGSADSDEFMVNPSAHLQWKVTGNDQLRFSFARTVRRPSIDQLVPAYSVESPGDEDVSIGNPGLAFETSWGVDIGYERRFAGRGIFGFNIFHRDIDDLIALVNTGDPVSVIGLDPADYPGGLYQYQNIGKAKVWGWEVDLSTPLTFLGLPETGIFANYTRLYSERADPASGRDIAIDYQPDYVYNFGVTQNLPQWNAAFGFSYQRQGESRFTTFGEIESQLYGPNLEVFVEKRFGRNWVLRLTGNNLLDARSRQAEAGFDGDNGAEILANQAAYDVDAFEVEHEESSPKWTLTLRVVF